MTDLKSIDPMALSQGNYSDAIEELTQANRRQPSPDREQLLTELRLLDFQKTNPPSSGETTPGAWGDPFANTNCIPEIKRDQLDVDTLAGGIQHHGALIVRNLISDRNASNLTHMIDRVLESQSAYLRGSSLEGSTPWFSPPEQLRDKLKDMRKFTNKDGCACAVDSPRAMFRILELYYQLGLKELFSEYFEEAPCIGGLKWVLRRKPPVASENAWHQDGAFMGTDVRSVNVWLALSHCGAGNDKAGLDLIPKRLNHIVQTGTDGAILDWTVGPDYVKREFASCPPVCPTFAPGDAILFDHYNLHRTSYSPTMTGHRYAIESWFFAQSNYAARQIPMRF